MVDDKWVQFKQLPKANSDDFIFELISIKDSSHKIIQMPVVSKNCLIHPKIFLTFDEVHKALSQDNQINCPCGKPISKLEDLIQDIRQLAYDQFHPVVEQVQIIEGILCHKYNRIKTYTDNIQEAIQLVPNFIQSLSKKYSTANSLSKMIEEQEGFGIFDFWALCLLDKVKIVLPIRMKNCKHPECYELTSLLDYQKKKITNYLECCHPDCKEVLDMSNLFKMFDGLLLDRDLLNLLNNSSPAQFKFQYDLETCQFNDDMAIDNGVSIDPYISKCYNALVNLQEAQIMIDINYFQYQVQNLVAQVIQKDFHIEKVQQSEDIIQIQDLITNEISEYPVRCYKCTDYKKGIDVRSYAADYFVAKNKGQKTLRCMICGFENDFLTKTLCNLIYFDHHLIKTISTKNQMDDYLQLKEDKLDKFYLRDKFNLQRQIQQPVAIDGLWNWNQAISYESSKTHYYYPLKKDIRWRLRKQFHSSVKFIQFQGGIAFHQSERKNKFKDILYKIDSSIISNLLQNFQNCYSIISLIQQNTPADYQFLALCLLDKVKILIPVRIKQCKHPECYELTSLLNEEQYFEEEKDFKCCYPGCKTSIKQFSLQNFKNDFVLDVDLLNILNASLPSQLIFIYKAQKKSFDLKLSFEKDLLFIKKIHQQFTEQDKNLIDLNDLIMLIQSTMTYVIQQGVDICDNKYKRFQIQEINMIDSFTQELIEIPIYYYNECMDLRCYLAQRFLKKRKGENYQNSGFEWYLNSYLISQIQIDQGYLQTKQIKYDGRLHCLEWLKKEYCLNKKKFLDELKSQSNTNVAFFKIYCPLSKKKIDNPFILPDCPQKLCIDFDFLYQKMIEIKFEFYTQNLKLCACENCSKLSYCEFIYYHEAYAEALSEFKKNQKYSFLQKGFYYDFSKKLIWFQKKDKLRQKKKIIC